MPAQSTLLSRLIHFLPAFCGIFLLLVTVLQAIIILPVGQNFLIDSKTLFFLLVGLIVFSVWIVMAFSKKTLQFTFSPFLLPALLFLISTIISSFLNAVYPMNQLLGYGGVYISACLIIILAPSLIPEKIGKQFLFIGMLPALLLALASASELLHSGPSVVLNMLLPLKLPNSPLFSLSGSPLIAFELIIIALTGAVTLLFTSKGSLKPFFLLATIVLIGGVVINIRTLSQQKILTDVLPPFAASWSVATDTLKSLKSTVIGAGPENYQQIYLNYKPAWVNTTPVWNSQFNQGSDSPLTLLVTNGLLGLVAWIWLAVSIVQHSRHPQGQTLPFAVMAVASLLVQLIFPPNIVIIAFQAFLLAFWIATEKNLLQDVQIHAFTVKLIKSGTAIQKVPRHSQVLVYVVCGLGALCILSGFWWLGKFTLSQYYIFQAFRGSLTNDALQVYTPQQEALKIYPYSNEYHRSFANTSFLIAENLAQNKELSDAERQQAVQLIQQAVQEARTTLTIEPSSSLNWLLVARIYSNLAGVVQDADNLSLTAYTQALALAPNDPTLNLELGNLYYRLGQFPKSITQLEKTVQLKPDWPNAYYNLANAYRQNKQFQQSYDAYQQTLVLLPSGEDFSKVKVEQDEVKKELDTQTQQTQEAQENQTLQNQATPTPTPKPQVQTVEPSLPPTPSPTPTPVEEVNPTEQPAQ